MNIDKDFVHPKEIEANRFALELLVPTPFFEREIKKYKESDQNEEGLVAFLAEKFNVSQTLICAKFQKTKFFHV